MDVLRTLFGSAAGIASAALILPAAASAADITVTTTSDENVNNTTCSLREAVKSAQSNSSAHEDACTAGESGPTDFVKLGALTYTLAGAANEDLNGSGDLDVDWTGNTQGFLVIDGTLGANDVPLSTIDAANVDRILDVNAGGTAALRVQNVILTNGAPPGAGSDGGAIDIGDDDAQFNLESSRVLNSDAGHYGGGLHFENGAGGSDVNIIQTEFAGNTAGDEGGALWIQDDTFPISVDRSSFVGNSAEMGGAIYEGSQTNNGQLFVVNSTISGNTAADAGGAFAFDADVGGNVYFRFTTIAGNSTPTAGGGGGVYTDAANQFVLIEDSILSGNTAAGVPANCTGPGPFSNNGFRNVESANTCGFITTAPRNNLINTDPLLAPVAFNTGPDQTTRTHGLYDGSPAIDTVPLGCAAATGVDQRNSNRPVGPKCDAGAFEGSVGPKPAVTPPPATTPPATTPAAKKCKRKKKKKGKSAVAAKKKGCKKKKKKKKKHK